MTAMELRPSEQPKSARPSAPAPSPNEMVPIASSSQGITTIAGLWDEWQDKASGEVLKSCAMIITDPNEFVAQVHDRMPVLLAQKDFEPLVER